MTDMITRARNCARRTLALNTDAMLGAATATCVTATRLTCRFVKC
jgi:hypothetical protein